MKEQERLRMELKYQYQLGNYEVGWRNYQAALQYHWDPAWLFGDTRLVRIRPQGLLVLFINEALHLSTGQPFARLVILLCISVQV